MVGICFTYESQLKNICSGTGYTTDMFRESAKVYGMTHMIVCDPDNLKPGFNDGDIVGSYCENPNLLPALYPDVTIVVIEAETYLDECGYDHDLLSSFVHPEEPVIYIVGRDSGGFNHVDMADNVKFVAIEQPITLAPVMWSIGSMMIVLHDRYVKGL